MKAHLVVLQYQEQPNQIKCRTFETLAVILERLDQEGKKYVVIPYE